MDKKFPDNSPIEGSIVFGPVPSRRLGSSLGINTMKVKTCTYNCVYCQVGRTRRCLINRDKYLNPHEVFKLAAKKIKLLSEKKVRIDYISIVPIGEPTLDMYLSEEIELLRGVGCKIAVFTNSSLLWNDEVKESLMLADYVSVKVDTVKETTWRKLDRPHGKLKLNDILNAVIEFSKSFKGVLSTETMLVKNINDNIDELKELSEYLRNIRRYKSYFTIPVRPPAECYVSAPDIQTLSELSGFIKIKISDSEMLCFSEGKDFDGADNLEEELLGIMAVHPMTEEAVKKFIISKHGDPKILERMIAGRLIVKHNYDGKTFYRNYNLVK